MNPLITGSILPTVAIMIWWGISALHIISPLLIPSPSDVSIAFWNILTDPHHAIWRDVAYTLVRVIAGITLGTCIGLPAGLLIGYYARLRQACMPWIDFIRSIPATALLPLFLLVFGLGESAKIALTGFVVTLILLVHTSYGIAHAHPTRLMIAQTMSLTRWAIFRHVLFLEALPYIAVGIRLSISLSVIIVIVSEMFVGTRYGLGLRIIDAQLVYETSTMYAIIVLTGILGYLLNRVYLFFEQRVVHWTGK